MAIALGAAIGGPLRYLMDRAAAARSIKNLPWATLTVNLVGSLLLGLVLGWATQHLDPALGDTAPRGTNNEQAIELIVAGVGVGFCGALTTWSTLAWEVVVLYRSRPAHAVSYAVGTVVTGIIVAAAGMFFGQLM